MTSMLLLHQELLEMKPPFNFVASSTSRGNSDGKYFALSDAWSD